MSVLNGVLKQVGVDLGVDAASNLVGAITDYNRQNLSPGDLALANAGLRVLAQATNVGGLVPGVVRRGTGGAWESVHYANDLNAHHPKFKFLFKVQFHGFPGGNFSYFVHRCDKPKIRFNHVDVNYYNFRTKVLTSTTFDPLTFTFLDEIGNTVNSFFALYTAQRSKQGDGMASIAGGEDFSSSVPYDNGFSAGKRIEIQQIFANGVATNIFTLINPRIDALEFDDLNMEMTAGSMMTCTVSYDAISCKTTGSETINSWGNTDLLRGGGTSGAANAGAASIGEAGAVGASSASGGGIGGIGNFLSSQAQNAFSVAAGAFAAANKVPAALADLIIPTSISALGSFNQPGIVRSTGDLVSQSIQSTLSSIANGTNLKFGGNNPNYSNEGRNYSASNNNANYSNEGRNFLSRTISPGGGG